LVRTKSHHDGPSYRRRLWLLLENGELELCRKDPGFEESLVVKVHNTRTFARWHLGLVSWGAAIKSGEIEVIGARSLARALPTWNDGPDRHQDLRANTAVGASH
jgi:hypothetical protein